MAVERQVRMETFAPPILGKEKNRECAGSARFGDRLIFSGIDPARAAELWIIFPKRFKRPFG